MLDLRSDNLRLYLLKATRRSFHFFGWFGLCRQKNMLQISFFKFKYYLYGWLSITPKKNLYFYSKMTFGYFLQRCLFIKSLVDLLYYTTKTYLYAKSVHKIERSTRQYFNTIYNTVQLHCQFALKLNLCLQATSLKKFTHKWDKQLGHIHKSYNPESYHIISSDLH